MRALLNWWMFLDLKIVLSSRIAGYLVGRYLSKMKHLGGGWMSYSKGQEKRLCMVHATLSASG